LIDTAGKVNITCADSLNKISFETDCCSGLTKEKIDELTSIAGIDIVEKELKRRFIVTCDRIDMLLERYKNTEWETRRANLKNLSEAEELLNQLEGILAPSIENNLIDKIQKML
jgi:hypothetical protein